MTSKVIRNTLTAALMAAAIALPSALPASASSSYDWMKRDWCRTAGPGTSHLFARLSTRTDERPSWNRRFWLTEMHGQGDGTVEHWWSYQPVNPQITVTLKDAGGTRFTWYDEGGGNGDAHVSSYRDFQLFRSSRLTLSAYFAIGSRSDESCSVTIYPRRRP